MRPLLYEGAHLYMLLFACSNLYPGGVKDRSPLSLWDVCPRLHYRLVSGRGLGVRELLSSLRAFHGCEAISYI